MKFSEAWLRTLCDPPLSSAQLQEALTMAGLEVEDAARAAPPFSGVVVAEIQRVEPHPFADRLRVCHVDAGTGEPLQIVCGAPNATAGMRAPLARVGARLPDGTTIARATMRDVQSNGMLCSAKELGIDDDASGLLALPAQAPIGHDVRDVLGLDDTLITLKLTPNRADCLSLLGIAREVHAITGASWQPPAATPVAVTTGSVRKVDVRDPAACPRFASRIIEGIDARAPTPRWMRQRLERSGIRSISAIVDVTNYVMLELGQPLHAYDDALLRGDVVVRFAKTGEKLTLLNGDTLDLQADLLMVCDQEKPLGLAGIMGGEHSGISDNTSTVFLEGAFWNPLVIQGKSRRLGFASDAGYRFERGVDPELGPRAVERATELIVSICGGRAGPLGDVRTAMPAPPAVRVRTSRIDRLLGVEIAPEEVSRFFTRLGFAYTRRDDEWQVTPPSHRFDLSIEEDFIEEVARLYGYDRIPAKPSAHVQRMLPMPERKRSQADLRARFIAREWQEVITFSFVSSVTEGALFAGDDAAHRPIRVLNPIASHLDVMRTTLAGGLIEVLRTNLARRQDRVRIFEIGRCFERQDHGECQPMRIGGLAYGDALAEQWGSLKRPVDFFDVKGDVQSVISPLSLRTRAAHHPALHPGRSAAAMLGDETIGWMGELHPRLVKSFELPRTPVLFELDLASLLAIPAVAPQAVSKLPRVRRDLAVVVDESITAQEVLDALDAVRPSAVSSVRLFDVYRGATLGPNKKSLAILVVMQDTERTLTDGEIDAVMADLLDVLATRFKATLRQ